MDTRTIRILLVLALLLGGTANFIDTAFPSLLSAPHQAAVAAQAAAFQTWSFGPTWLFLSLLLVLVTLVAAFGLWQLQTWGAWLGAVTTVAGFTLLLAGGSHSVSGVALALAQLGAGLWFVVLAASFMRLRSASPVASAV